MYPNRQQGGFQAAGQYAGQPMHPSQIKYQGGKYPQQYMGPEHSMHAGNMQNNMYPQGPNGGMGNGGYGRPMDGNHYAMQQMQGGRQGPNNGMGQAGYNPNPGMGNQMGAMGGGIGPDIQKERIIATSDLYPPPAEYPGLLLMRLTATPFQGFPESPGYSGNTESLRKSLILQETLDSLSSCLDPSRRSSKKVMPDPATPVQGFRKV